MSLGLFSDSVDSQLQQPIISETFSGKALTPAELESRVLATADYLFSQGFKPGDALALLSANSVQTIQVLLQRCMPVCV